MKLSPAEVQGAFLRVRAGGRAYALPIGHVHSVFRVGAVTRVPLAPAWLAGLTNMRSLIMPVVCLARRFDPAAAICGAGALAVVTGLEADAFALAVDDAEAVIAASPANLLDTPIHMDFEHAALTLGALRTGSTIIPVLDVPKIFDARRPVEPRRERPNEEAGAEHEASSRR